MTAEPSCCYSSSAVALRSASTDGPADADRRRIICLRWIDSCFCASALSCLLPALQWRRRVFCRDRRPAKVGNADQARFTSPRTKCASNRNGQRRAAEAPSSSISQPRLGASSWLSSICIWRCRCRLKASEWDMPPLSSGPAMSRMPAATGRKWDMQGSSCHKVGSETVNGRSTVKYETTNASGDVSHSGSIPNCVSR